MCVASLTLFSAFPENVADDTIRGAHFLVASHMISTSPSMAAETKNETENKTNFRRSWRRFGMRRAKESWDGDVVS